MYIVYHDNFGEAIYGSLTNALRYIARRMSPVGQLHNLCNVTVGEATAAGFKITHERRPS